MIGLLLSFFIVGAQAFLEVDTVTDYSELQCANGTSVMAFLFEWRWDDIEKECPKLAQIGYCSVQTSIANEHAIVDKRPWWERYQPVSYKLVTRSGDEKAFASMVKTCNDHGIRVVVDVVLNHMARGAGVGTAGSSYDSKSLQYPAAGYTKEDFKPQSLCSHTGQSLSPNYSTPNDYRDCWLFDLPDLQLTRPNVQDKLSGFLNHLVSLGVAGFRLDAAKYERPSALLNILGKVKKTLWGSRPFVYSQVSNVLPKEIVHPNEYFQVGRVTEFRLATRVAKAFKSKRIDSLYSDVDKDLIPSDKAMSFVDMQTLQRGTLEGADTYLNFKDPRNYGLATAYILGSGYGMPRVMSSFFFVDVNAGPASDGNGEIKRALSASSDKCTNGFVCEHRWEVIQAMVRFRNAISNGSTVQSLASSFTNKVLGLDYGDKGFLAISSDRFKITFRTRLPAGEYCDLISNCDSKVRVRSDGLAMFTPYTSTSLTIVAIVNEKDRTF